MEGTAQNLDIEVPKQDLPNGTDSTGEPPLKKVRLEEPASDQQNGQAPPRLKGVAPIKAEYAVLVESLRLRTCAD